MSDDLVETLAQQTAECLNGGEFRDGKWYTEGQRDAWRNAMRPIADRIEALERERDAAICELGKWSRKAGTVGRQLDDVQAALNAALYAVNSARNEALEEAARVVIPLAEKLSNPRTYEQAHYLMGLDDMAAAIRALIDLPLPQQDGPAAKADADQ